MQKILIIALILLAHISCRKKDVIDLSCETSYNSVAEVRNILTGRWKMDKYIHNCQWTNVLAGESDIELIFPDTSNSEDYIVSTSPMVLAVKHTMILAPNDTIVAWSKLSINNDGTMAFFENSLKISASVGDPAMKICEDEFIWMYNENVCQDLNRHFYRVQ